MRMLYECNFCRERYEFEGLALRCYNNHYIDKTSTVYICSKCNEEFNYEYECKEHEEEHERKEK